MENLAQRSQAQRKIKTQAEPVPLWYSHPATLTSWFLKATTHGSLSFTHLGNSLKRLMTMCDIVYAFLGVQCCYFLFIFFFFFLSRCGHCKKLAPEWKTAAKNLKGKMKLGQVDCESYKVYLDLCALVADILTLNGWTVLSVQLSVLSFFTFKNVIDHKNSSCGDDCRI